MLQIMHDKMQGWVAGIIAGVIALTFMLWGVQNYLSTGVDTQIVVKINGKKITRAQENIAYEQIKRSEMMQLGQNFSLDQKTQAQLKKRIRQQLIEKEVLSQEIDKMGFDIGQEQLWAVVSGLPIFQQDGSFSIDYFRQITERLFYSEKVFFEGLKDAMLQSQLERGIVGSDFDLPNEIETVKKMFKQVRDFEYFVISPERFAKTTKISDADVQKYYDQHQSEFIIPEKISIQYLELSSDALHDEVGVSRQQLKEYYQSHIDSFSTPKKWQITRVLLPLSQTADAKALDGAREKLSQIKPKDDFAKVAGARVNKVWLTKKEAGVDFAAQLENLSVGQISKPLRTKDGYSLVKVLSIQPEKVKPYKAVAAKVKQTYKHQELARLFAEANDKLVDLTYTNPDSLEPAAKELGLKIQKTNWVTKDGGEKGILANNKIIKAAFSEAVLEQRYNSNPIEIGTGKLLVLRIKDHMPQSLQPLDKVRVIIAKKLKAKEMKNQAHELSQELLAELRKGKALSKIVKQHKFVLNKMVDVSRDRYSKKITKLVEVAFDLNKPSSDEVSAAVVDLGGDYSVLQLTKVHENKSHKETKKGVAFLKSLPNRLGKFDYQLLVDNLMSRAKITVTEEI
jgi:peptidyl-prolyl cis-trans isomerase D